MAIEVTMPQMGADMTEGTLVRWIKQIGDTVARGEIIAEIETDKATIELEAFESGTLLKHVVPEGETVPVNTVIALLGDASEVEAAGEPEPKAEQPARAAAGSKNGATEEQVQPEAAPQRELPKQEPLKRPIHQVAGDAPSVVTAYQDDGEHPASRIRISPVARRIALEEGVDVRNLQGSGPDGRILRRDVEAFIASGSTATAAAPGREAAGRTVARPGAPGTPAGREAAPPPPSGEEPAETTETSSPSEVEGEIKKAEAVPTPAESPKPSEISGEKPVSPRPARVASEEAAAEEGREAAPPAERPRPAAAAAGAQPLSRMRQAIARRMTASKQQQPHYYLTLDVDMTDAMEFRKQLNAAASEAQRVSINDLIVKACAVAIERHPKFNAEFGESGLEMHEHINICIGIALDEGLIAPAILDAGNKSLGRIAVESKDLVNRAKSGKLRADEYSEGTFTITNLGAYGVETLIGIINPPQAAILGVGSVMPAAVVRDNEVVIRQVMKVALSADHRVTDGAEGARFIKEIQSLLENPASLAL